MSEVIKGTARIEKDDKGWHFRVGPNLIAMSLTDRQAAAIKAHWEQDAKRSTKRRKPAADKRPAGDDQAN